MKYIVLALLLLTSFTLADTTQKKKFNHTKLDKIPVNEIARYLANEISKNLPLQLDYLTKVTRALAYNNTLTTYKEVDFNHKDFQKMWSSAKDELIEIMFKQDTEVLCYDPFDYYLLAKRKMIFIYKITNQNNKALFEYTVNKQDCYNLNKK